MTRNKFDIGLVSAQYMNSIDVLRVSYRRKYSKTERRMLPGLPGLRNSRYAGMVMVLDPIEIIPRLNNIEQQLFLPRRDKLLNVH
jgi:hypothetical protein